MRTFKKGPHIKMMRNKRNTSVKGKAMNIKPGLSIYEHIYKINILDGINQDFSFIYIQK